MSTNTEPETAVPWLERREVILRFMRNYAHAILDEPMVGPSDEQNFTREFVKLLGERDRALPMLRQGKRWTCAR